jgi:RHS repeat-associated protein
MIIRLALRSNIFISYNKCNTPKDHLGSIRVIVDEAGEIVSYDDYDPWGMVLAGRSGNDGFANDKYKFTGKERDVETGYDYFGARYYDSRIGRWLQVDPLADKYPGWSPYNYTLNNPLKFIDPDGNYVKNKIRNTYVYTQWTVQGAINQLSRENIPFIGNLFYLDRLIRNDKSFSTSFNEAVTVGLSQFTTLGAGKLGLSAAFEIGLSGLGFTTDYLNKGQLLNLIIDEGTFNAALGTKINGYPLAAKVGGIDSNGNPVEDASADGKMIMLHPLLRQLWEKEYKNNPTDVLPPDERFDNYLDKLRQDYIDENFNKW